MRRPALVTGLVEADHAQLALIVAPAGYGKTSLLCEWAQCDERPFAWVSLGRAQRATLSAVSEHEALGGTDGLLLLVRKLRTRHRRFVVVVDDAHLAPPRTLGQAVEAALEELPTGSTIALSTRTEPELAIGRLRAHRLLSEIRTPQLAMSTAEAAALLREEGLEPEFEQVRALVGRTEGWPAALYLAALALREDPFDVGHFDGRHHLMADYLREAVLSTLPVDLVGFAVRGSVLDELSAPICDFVLERSGSSRAVERLAAASPLLMAVDRAHRSYRWHRLVREALTAELQRSEPDDEQLLRLRASSWYTGHGETERAIDQAAAAGDAELTADLLWSNILPYLTHGRSDRVRGWLGSFCSDRIADHAALALSAALSSLMSGDADEAQRWTLAATAALDDKAMENGLGSLQTGLAVVEAMRARDGVAQMADDASKAAETVPEYSPWRPLCLMLKGVSLHLLGDRDGAEEILEHAAGLSSGSEPSVAARCLAERAMIAFERQDWELAEELTERALTIAEQSGLGDDPLSAIVFAAAAASRAHHGRIDEAKRDLRHGRDLLAALGDFVPWYGAETRILLAHASLWLADVVGARTLLAEASRFARRTAGAEIFPGWFDQAWAYMDTLAETSLVGPSSLTIAELRILRFLPSHRSFREIAEQLGVSANTVKTQAHAVYRKLGAASRSEAVTLATEAGLLGQ